MNKAAVKPTTKGEKTPPSTWDGWVVALQLLDTTWRVALPILLLSYGGTRLDRHWHSTPLLSLIGFFVSLPLAVLLVYRQIKAAYPDAFKTGQTGAADPSSKSASKTKGGKK
ncbi:MAG: hypothetical protein JWS12_813 [Candidatus Saccharibacteria bacterium]|nr:hypothetical protein [Candidatus Saccharibacteria bacterium]